MSRFHQLMQSMQDAMLTGEASRAANDYKDKPDFSAAQQLSIYIDGYRTRLHGVVAEEYPSLKYYMGERMFNSLVADYVESTPSRHYSIDVYPFGLPAFIASKSSDRFLIELSTIEAATREVYMLPESAALSTQWLLAQTPDALVSAALPLRTASRLLAFTYPVNDYLTAFRAEENPAPPSPSPCYVMTVRHRNQVQRHALAREEYHLLRGLSEGKTLGDILESAAFDETAQQAIAANLQSWFTAWFTHGMIRAA